MNRSDITTRQDYLTEQRKQVLAKQEEGKNVILSGQKIVEETNVMLNMISGADQDCQFWLQQIDLNEKKTEAEIAQTQAASDADTIAPYEAAEVYKEEQESVE